MPLPWSTAVIFRVLDLVHSDDVVTEDRLAVVGQRDIMEKSRGCLPCRFLVLGLDLDRALQRTVRADVDLVPLERLDRKSVV